MGEDEGHFRDKEINDCFILTTAEVQDHYHRFPLWLIILINLLPRLTYCCNILSIKTPGRIINPHFVAEKFIIRSSFSRSSMGQRALV